MAGTDDTAVVTLVSTSDTLDEVQQALGVKQEDRVAEVEKPVEEVKPAEKAVEPEAKTTADDDDQGEESEPEKIEAKPAEKKKPSQRLQSRIDEIVRDRDKAAGEAAALKAETEALRRKVDELVAGKPAEKTGEPAKAEEAKKPTVAEYDTYELYTEAVAEWTAARAVKVALAAQADEHKKLAETAKKAVDDEKATVAKNAAAENYNTITAAAIEKYDDYLDTVNQPGLMVAHRVLDRMVTSKLGAEVAYYLGKNPETCKSLYAMGDSDAAIEHYGEILADVKATLKASETKTDAPVVVAKKVVTKAPDPIEPLKGGDTKVTIPLDQAPYQDFKVKRNKDRKDRGLHI